MLNLECSNALPDSQSGSEPPNIPYHVMWGRVDEANMLVRKYHYSARIPMNIQAVITWHLPGGLLGDTGDAIAACYFTIPPTRWPEPVWELARLVRWEGSCPPLTKLIGQAVKQIKSQNATDVIVSFADMTEGHHGGVYQAASWQYAGFREPRITAILVNGVRYTCRKCNHVWGTSSPSKLKGITKADIVPVIDEGKHLYWKAVNRDGEKKAERLGLGKLPYPKPGVDHGKI